MMTSDELEWLSPQLDEWAHQRLRLKHPEQTPAAVRAEPEAAPLRQNRAAGADVSARRKKLKPFFAAAAILLAVLVGYAGFSVFSAAAERSALAGARQAAKRAGEALVAGDSEAFARETLSIENIAVLTAAEVAPEMLKSDDAVLVSAFNATLEARAFDNIGQNLVNIDAAETYVVSKDRARVFWVVGADDGDLMRVLIFKKAEGRWKLVFWTPPMDAGPLANFIATMNREEGSLDGIPGVAETLMIAGISYERMSDGALADAGDSAGMSEPEDGGESELAADGSTSASLSESAVDYAAQLGGTPHNGDTLYMIIGASMNFEELVQQRIDDATPSFGDMQSYFVVQKSDNFEGLEPGWFIAIEAYADEAHATDNLDFARRGFEDPYIKKVVVRTDDPIPVYEELVDGL
ncbi:MAG: hypothetical protein Q7W44_07540 [Coriobacteriia bacterium]|nr:hypothetical protein [Coriobacteriia bacterium]